MNASTDRIERQMILKAPRSKVWRAITNAEEFGKWFGVKLAGKTFVPGKNIQAQITIPGFEHVTLDIVIDRIEPETQFSYRWHPYAVDPAVDYSKEESTLVVFELKDVEGGTLLRLTESDFDKIPPERRLEAFRMNSGGWDAQMENIRKHVETT